ncbi:hypothetical protein ACWKWU_08980 [Chitinophaga lutea]
MSIDIQISNYEEYLFRYVDGELDAAETAALESFLDRHPALRQELELLLSTRLVPEPVVFDGKASLYRGATGLHNYLPALQSYLDGELSPAESAAFESFVAEHTSVQKELEIWKAARVVPDMNVRFPDKSSLYRHTRQGRTVRMRTVYWWASAAVVAGALFLVLNGRQPDAQQPSVAVNQPASSPSAPNATTLSATQAAAVNDNAANPSATIAQANTPNPANAADPSVMVAANATQASRQSKKPVVLAAVPAPRKAAPVTAAPTTHTPDVMDLDALRNDAPTIARGQLSRDAAPVATQEPIRAEKRIVASVEAPAAALATVAPAEKEPGEFIMSVSGNGVESKVLDKVANVAKLFARKKNK